MHSHAFRFFLKDLQNLIFAFGLVLTGCATSPSRGPEKQPAQPTANAPKPTELGLEDHFDEIEDALEMIRDKDELGFSEKVFNACDMGFSRTECGPQYFATLYFRVRCRASTGTVESVSEAEMKPLESDGLLWRIGTVNGETLTDSEGYGQLRFVSKTSSKNKKLILISGKNSLGQSVSEAGHFVLPRDWCDRE